MPTQFFRCDICGKLYRNYKDARDCEWRDSPCSTCENAYYVYGVELNCQYKYDCGSSHKFYKKEKGEK